MRAARYSGIHVPLRCRIIDFINGWWDICIMKQHTWDVNWTLREDSTSMCSIARAWVLSRYGRGLIWLLRSTLGTTLLVGVSAWLLDITSSIAAAVVGTVDWIVAACTVWLGVGGLLRELPTGRNVYISGNAIFPVEVGGKVLLLDWRTVSGARITLQGFQWYSTVICLGSFGLLVVAEGFVWLFRTALCRAVILGMTVVSCPRVYTLRYVWVDDMRTTWFWRYLTSRRSSGWRIRNKHRFFDWF